jgi:hypothetical protein
VWRPERYSCAPSSQLSGGGPERSPIISQPIPAVSASRPSGIATTSVKPSRSGPNSSAKPTASSATPPTVRGRGIGSGGGSGGVKRSSSAGQRGRSGSICKPETMPANAVSVSPAWLCRVGRSGSCSSGSGKVNFDTILRLGQDRCTGDSTGPTRDRTWPPDPAYQGWARRRCAPDAVLRRLADAAAREGKGRDR